MNSLGMKGAQRRRGKNGTPIQGRIKPLRRRLIYPRQPCMQLKRRTVH